MIRKSGNMKRMACFQAPWSLQENINRILKDVPATHTQDNANAAC